MMKRECVRENHAGFKVIIQKEKQREQLFRILRSLFTHFHGLKDVIFAVTMELSCKNMMHFFKIKP